MRLIRRLIFLGLTLVACQLNPFLVEPTQPTRSISETNLNVSEIWRVSDLFVSGPTYQFLNFVLVNDQIVAVNDRAGIRAEVVSFSTDDGQTLWEFGRDGFSVSSMDNNLDSLFLASSGERVKAYSLQTGELQWTSDAVLTDRRPNYLQYHGDTLFNYAVKDDIEIIHSFDPQTGDTLNVKRVSVFDNKHGELLLQFDDAELRSLLGNLTKVDPTTNEMIWTTRIDSGRSFVGGMGPIMIGVPVLSDNKLVIVSIHESLVIDVFDYNTGDHIWGSDRIFASNTAVSGGKVYALTNDARLIVFDLATGTELGFVQFTPTQTYARYWVGADEEGRVFVYFADSQELITLKTP